MSSRSANGAEQLRGIGATEAAFEHDEIGGEALQLALDRAFEIGELSLASFSGEGRLCGAQEVWGPTEDENARAHA